MNAKFKVGQQVRGRSRRLRSNTSWTVIAVSRQFAAVDAQGNREFCGLVWDEEDIPHIKGPYKFDGQTLSYEVPEEDFGTVVVKARTCVFKFSGYAYTVEIERSGLAAGVRVPGRYLFSESKLKAI